MFWWISLHWLLFIWPFGAIRCQGVFDDLLKSTKQLVNFYKEQFGNMNLDGIYGLRVIEGQTLLLLQKSTNLDPRIHSFLVDINQEAHNISESSLSFLKKSQGEYFVQLEPLVDRPLLIAEDYRRIDPKLKWSRKTHGYQKAINERKSDECIGNLLGSRSRPKCYMPKDCLDIFTEPGYTDYSLTHQLLYTLISQQFDCTAQLEDYLQNKGYYGGVAHLRLEFCTNIFYDAASVVQKLNKNLKPITQDLFMEQIFSCGVMGFMEFVHVDWLHQVISWQKPSGCFGAMPRQTDKEHLPKDVEYRYLDDMAEEVKKVNKFGDFYDDKNQEKVLAKKLPGLNSNNVEKNGDLLHGGNEQDDFNEQPDVNKQQGIMKQQGFNQNDLPENNYDANKRQFKKELLNQTALENMVHEKREDIQQVEQQQAQQQPRLQPQMISQVLNGFQPPDPLQYKLQQQNGIGQPAQAPIVQPSKLAANTWQTVVQQAVVQRNVGNKNVLYMDTELTNHSRNRDHGDFGQRRQDLHLAMMRRLLVEKSLEGGCLAHKTAVAAGVLSQYLRFFIDPGSPEYRAQIQVDGVNQMMLPLPKGDYSNDVDDHVNQGMEQLPVAGDSSKDVYMQGKNKNYPGNNDDKPQAYYNDETDNRGNDNDDAGDDDFDNRELPNRQEDNRADNDMMYAKQDERLTGDKLYMEEKDSVLADDDGDDDDDEVKRMNPKHQPILAFHNKADEAVAKNYPYYYDDQEKKNEENMRNKPVEQDIKPRNVVLTPMIGIMKNSHDTIKVDTGVSVGTSYAVLLVCMILLLYYMNRFVRRRRVLIKYR